MTACNSGPGSSVGAQSSHGVQALNDAVDVYMVLGPQIVAGSEG